MSFAKEYWEEFERLSVDLLKSYFRDIDEANISVRKTQSKKDGGYDGIVIISDTSNNVSYKILSESKLRAISKKDLAMSDFSKALVIAINMAAHELYIFTNLHFSYETQKRIKIFSNMTNIKVNLMDIFHVTEDFKKMLFDVDSRYSKELLDGLADSLKEQPQINKTDFCFSKYGNQLEELTGGRRKELLEETFNQMKSKTGIYILMGTQGSGKTLFIKHLITRLCNDKPFLCTDVDMVKFSNINDFLILLLSIIWQVDVLDINKFNKEDIEDITDYIGDEEMSVNAKNILLDIISSENSTNFVSKDMMYYYTMEYLHRVYIPILKHQKQVLVFHNIEYATNIAKDILLMFIKRFYNDNIIIILEARNEITEAQKFIQRCVQEVPIVGTTTIPEFDISERMLYLKSKYSKKYSRNQLKIMERVCPNNPLLIDQTINLFLNGTIKQHWLDESMNSIYKLYKNPKYLGSLYNQYVNHVMHACDDEAKRCAASIAFFDGTLNIKYISTLCANPKVVINQLVETCLFELKDNTIEIYHICVLEPLMLMNYINSIIARHEIYEQLFDLIDSTEILSRKKELKKMYLALELNKKEYIFAQWKNVCSCLIKEEDYEVALKLLKKLYNILQEDNNILNIFTLNFFILQCYLGDNNYVQDKINEYIQNIDELLLDNIHEICISDMDEYLFAKAKYYLAIGKYTDLINCTQKHIFRNPKLYCIEALGIKHVYGLDECLSYLQKGITQFPEFKYMYYSYYDHMLSKFYKYDLSKTKDCIEHMRPFTSILSLEDMIHYKYNEQCVLFYNLELQNLNELHRLLSISFQNNLPVEQSRICNLIGQFYWLKKETTKAIESFNEAAELQQYTNHQTYWWIAETNLALLYFELKENEMCINLINKIFEVYSKNNWDKIQKFFLNKGITSQKIIFNKEIVSVLLLFSLLYKMDSNIIEEIIHRFFKKAHTLLEIKWLKREYILSEFGEDLDKTSYYFAGHYMIKC